MVWKVLRMIGIGLLILIVGFALFVTFNLYKFGKQSQGMSPELGLVEGKLRDCPGTPNCVLSYLSDEQHGIDAITGGEAAFAKLVSFLQSQPDVKVVSANETYVYATFTSGLFKFVDDLELLLDGDVIQVRSASRVGKSDMGANRERVEMLRAIAN